MRWPLVLIRLILTIGFLKEHFGFAAKNRKIVLYNLPD
jgi:hypothetical protein